MGIASGVGKVLPKNDNCVTDKEVTLYPSQQISLADSVEGCGSKDEAQDDVTVIDIEELFKNASQSVIEQIIKSKESIDKENEEYLKKQKELIDQEDDEGVLKTQDELDRVRENLENLVGNIVNKAIEQNKVEKDKLQKLIDEENKTLTKKLELDKVKEQQLTETEKQKLETIKKLEKEKADKLAKEKAQEELLRKQQELMLKLIEEKKKILEANKKALEEAAKKSMEEYEKQLSEVEKTKFKEDKKNRDEEIKQQTATPSASVGTGGANPGSSPSETVSPSPSETVSPDPSETVSPSPSETVSPDPSETVSPSPSETVSPNPSETVSPDPSETESPDPSESEDPTSTEAELSYVGFFYYDIEYWAQLEMPFTFISSKTFYTGSAPAELDSIGLKLLTVNEDSVVSVSVNDQESEYSESDDIYYIPLRSEHNTIKIHVSAPDESEKVYEFNINLEIPDFGLIEPFQLLSNSNLNSLPLKLSHREDGTYLAQSSVSETVELIIGYQLDDLFENIEVIIDEQPLSQYPYYLPSTEGTHEISINVIDNRFENSVLYTYRLEYLRSNLPYGFLSWDIDGSQTPNAVEGTNRYYVINHNSTSELNLEVDQGKVTGGSYRVGSGSYLPLSGDISLSTSSIYNDVYIKLTLMDGTEIDYQLILEGESPVPSTAPLSAAEIYVNDESLSAIDAGNDTFVIYSPDSESSVYVHSDYGYGGDFIIESDAANSNVYYDYDSVDSYHLSGNTYDSVLKYKIMVFNPVHDVNVAREYSLLVYRGDIPNTLKVSDFQAHDYEGVPITVNPDDPSNPLSFNAVVYDSPSIRIEPILNEVSSVIQVFYVVEGVEIPIEDIEGLGLYELNLDSEDLNLFRVHVRDENGLVIKYELLVTKETTSA
ncbi:cadherin-like beta sandwich domain-containing protein [Cohnella lupini]|nr:cadherin-like beta sandwich domain-containing protein [Cohnella lupini]